MTQTWQTHCYHYTFSCGNIVSLSYLSNWRKESLYDPICHFIYIFHKYIEIFYVWWTTCNIQDRHRWPIHRICSTKRYIFVSDINVPIGVLTDWYGYIGTTRKITSSSTREVMWRGCDLVVLRSLQPTRRDTDNQVFEVTSHPPG